MLVSLFGCDGLVIVGAAVVWQLCMQVLADLLLVRLPSVCLWAWGVVVVLCHALHGHVMVVDVVVGGVAIV